MTRTFFSLILLPLLAAASTLCAQPLEHVSPEAAGMSSRHLQYADEAIEKAIADGDIPGAVLTVVRNGKIAYQKAYGERRVTPNRERMTVNTVFDLASLSKPVAAAISAMILVERGQIRLLDPADYYIKGFRNWRGANGKQQKIRIIDLMTHTSGLPAYVTLARLQRDFGAATPETLMKYICNCDREFEPKTGFRYSDLNYITLQYIIEKVSGQSLRDFARENIFAPLAMDHTDYIPCAADTSGRWYAASRPCWDNGDGAWAADIAPTEKLPDGQVLCGTVHDPLARLKGGVSGNAGLFSTADDLALLCATLMAGGQHNGVRILSPLTVDMMSRIPRATADIGRTPAWDVFTAYASANGDLFSPSTYGHTGHTGTAIVIDPENDTALILLTNTVHPSEGHSIVRLRSLISNIVAAAIRPAE